MYTNCGWCVKHKLYNANIFSKIFATTTNSYNIITFFFFFANGRDSYVSTVQCNTYIAQASNLYTNENNICLYLITTHQIEILKFQRSVLESCE